MNSWWPSASDLVGLARGDAPATSVEDLGADLVERAAALEDAAGVDVHVVGQPPVGLGVGADLDHRRDRRADDRAAAGREQDDMRAAGDQLDDRRRCR